MVHIIDISEDSAQQLSSFLVADLFGLLVREIAWVLVMMALNQAI